VLRGLDILFVLKVLASGPDSFANLGRSIGISASQAHSAMRRALESGLLRSDMSVRHVALMETLVAIKHYLPAKRGGESRGVPTAHAAPFFTESGGHELSLLPVWPHPEGEVRGLACEPIYKTVPIAALADPRLYEYLALVDMLRIGTARDHELARKELISRLGVGP
jgi:DNA-binding Lrp family transcriptional regulator